MRIVRDLILDNMESIRSEIAFDVWFVRCKLAATFGVVAALLGRRAWKRGTANKPAWFSRTAAFFFFASARILAPSLIVNAADHATREAGY